MYKDPKFKKERKKERKKETCDHHKFSKIFSKELGKMKKNFQ